ncbi:tripartite tricarboxylate transporter TctB family protein [Roseibium sp. M-1]
MAALLLLLCGLFLVFFVFPGEIPEGLRGDFSAGHYPRAIMIGSVASSIVWLVMTWVSPRGGADVEAIPAWRRTLAIFVAILAGYVLFTQVGFIIAGFFLIVVLSHLIGERGWAPCLLAAGVPVCVYFFLLKVLEVRLPSAIF